MKKFETVIGFAMSAAGFILAGAAFGYYKGLDKGLEIGAVAGRLDELVDMTAGLTKKPENQKKTYEDF